MLSSIQYPSQGTLKTSRKTRTKKKKKLFLSLCKPSKVFNRGSNPRGRLYRYYVTVCQ
nr:MAG TPA: hypothetical protein [Caudoviricetes sp.]